MDYSVNGLDESVEILLNTLLRVRQGENLLVYLDKESDCHVSNAIQAHAEAKGVRTKILTLNSDLPVDDQSRQLVEEIKQGDFQVICELSEQCFYLTDSWRVAKKCGARTFSLAGLDEASFIRCVGQVNHETMIQFGHSLQQILRKSRHIRIFTENGTDIRMQFKLNPFKRLIARFPNGPWASILPPTGILDDKTHSTFLGGQLSFRGNPSTISGTAVIDGYLWPPAEIGRLDQPIIVKITKGKVVDICGCPLKSKSLARWFEGQPIPVEHFCIGFNPGAKLSGKILEAERVFGSISIGMGKGLLHVDGVIKKPSIQANKNVIEENGSFVSERLLSLEKRLLRNEPDCPLEM
jgi:leucyl aminopeptidase (aminopeptidase T)